MINFIKKLFSNNKKNVINANDLNNKQRVPAKKNIIYSLYLEDGAIQHLSYEYSTQQEKEEINLSINKIQQSILEELKTDSQYFVFGNNIIPKSKFKYLCRNDLNN